MLFLIKLTKKDMSSTIMIISSKILTCYFVDYNNILIKYNYNWFVQISFNKSLLTLAIIFKFFPSPIISNLLVNKI